MINPRCLLRLMVVGFVVNHRGVAPVTGAGFEGDLVIGRDDVDFDEKVGKVHAKIQKKRFDLMWEKRRALLEELRKDNISVELDSEDTRREHMMVTKRKMQTEDTRLPPIFFHDLPLPTRRSEEVDNPELSRDIRKLQHSIESVENKATRDDEMVDMLDLSKRYKIDLAQTGQTVFTIEPFHGGMDTAELKRKLKSVEACDIVVPDSQRTQSREEHDDKMPIFRSDYLDSSIIRGGKRSESEPDDPSIYDFDQPTEDPIEKYGKIDLDLVKLFSLENSTLKELYLNNSRAVKKQKQAFLRRNANTTLINFNKFKLPRSEESMINKHEVRMYDQDVPQTKYPLTLNSELEQEQVFAEYFTGGSSSSADSHMNTNEFYEELVKVDFDITRNKKLLAVFQMFNFKNATIERKIEEKIDEKEKRRTQSTTIRGTKQKRTTKTYLERLIEDVEKMSTRHKKLEFQVTKKERAKGNKTASDELRMELEHINMGKEKVVGKRGRTKKVRTSKTTAKKSQTKPITRRTKSTAKHESDEYDPAQRIMDKFTLPKMSLRSTLKPKEPIADSVQHYTLADYDLKDFGIDVNDENANNTQVQSIIQYEHELSDETKKQIKKEQEDQLRMFARDRKKRFAQNMSDNKTMITPKLHTIPAMKPIDKKTQRANNEKVLSNKTISEIDTHNTHNVTNEIRDGEEKDSNSTENFEETDPWFEHFTIDTKEIDFENKDSKGRHKIHIDQSRILYEDELSEESKKEIRADENRRNEAVENVTRQKENIKNIFELLSQRMATETNQTDKYEQKEDIKKTNNRNKLFEMFNQSINKTRRNHDKVIDKRRKRDVRTDEEILKKYTKRMNNRVLQKRFQKGKKTGNLGYMDDQAAEAYYKKNKSNTNLYDEAADVSVMSVQYNEEVLQKIMGLSGENDTNGTNVANKNDAFLCAQSNETLSRGFELEVEQVPIRTSTRTHKHTTCRGSTKRNQKANPRKDDEQSNDAEDVYKEMKNVAEQDWNPANMGMGGGSYDSEQTDKSFYEDYKNLLRRTLPPSNEMIDLAKARDSEIDSFIRRKEEATRQANILRDLIVTTRTSVTYKTRRTFNRRILVNCTGSVVDHRFNLLIPPRLKRTHHKIYVTEYPRYNIFWYYSMWPNMAKLLDKYTVRKRNSTAHRSTKYPKTIPTIYITKRKTTHLMDRILNNLYNSTKYAKTKYYKPSFNSDVEFEDKDHVVTKKTTAQRSEDASNKTSTRKSKKSRTRKSRLRYVKTKVEILENNDLIDNRNWGMVVRGSNFTRSLVLRKLLRTSPSTEWHVRNVPTRKNLAREKAYQERLYNRYYGLTTLTPLPWVEENIKKMRAKAAQRAQEDMDYRGQYDIKEYADYLDMDPNYFFDPNKETVPFELETLPHFEHFELNNLTDFTYTEYDVPTDPTFTFDPVYHDNVEQLVVMRKPTRTTFDPTAMNEWNYKRFFTWTTTRRRDRTTTEMIIWTERTFRARMFNAELTDYVPVYTCHQCPARFLNNEEIDGQAMLMRHFVKHQNLEELYYPIGWRFEKSNKTRWYNERVRRYFMRLLREQDTGLSAMK